MKRKDLVVITGFCFSSAIMAVVIWEIVNSQVFNSNVFAKSGKEIVHKVNSGKKGEKAFAGPTTDYIDGVQVKVEGTPNNGDVLKYDGDTDNRWEFGADDNDGGSSALWELTSDTARLKTAYDINFQDKHIKDAKVPAWYYTAGSTLLKSSDSEVSGTGTSHSLAKTIKCPEQDKYSTSNTFTIYFETSASGASYFCSGQIRVNGVAVGTYRNGQGTTWRDWTEDISGIVPGDDIELYFGSSSTNSNAKRVRNFRIKGTENWEYVSLNASPTW